MPGDVALADGEGDLGPVGVVTGDDAEEQFCLPIVVVTVVPACAEAHEANAAGILDDVLVRDKARPAVAIAFDVTVVARRRVCLSGSCDGNSGQCV